MSGEYDEVGIWSEVKLAIIKEYAAAYTRILDSTKREKIPKLEWIYIDAYAGAGKHLSKTTGELVDGSPSIALKTVPPFHEYHFIDADAARASRLRALGCDRQDVFVYNDDCNDILLHKVFPRAKYADYSRSISSRRSSKAVATAGPSAAGSVASPVGAADSVLRST